MAPFAGGKAAGRQAFCVALKTWYKVERKRKDKGTPLAVCLRRRWAMHVL